MVGAFPSPPPSTQEVYLETRPKIQRFWANFGVKVTSFFRDSDAKKSVTVTSFWRHFSLHLASQARTVCLTHRKIACLRKKYC